MLLTKFMHPRNKYKKAPDFKQLVVLYPEFRKVAITDLTGKIKIDFKNEESLRVLTEILLKHDFNLNVKIPPNKLVPTLPLRLNYILWIEDLIKYASLGDLDEVTGIDIGTGAVCIYPLLFAKTYGSRMIGTEIDETSVQTATQHVKDNNLDHLIKVLRVKGDTILKDIVEDGKTYHFTMCNPPFFDTEEPLEKPVKKLPPRNAPTGNNGELTIQGGERTFIMQMIDESFETKKNVQIYTTMFGKRSNLLFLLKLLKKRNIENATWTEFCQGHTKRWGLAWTFLPKDILDLRNAPVIRKSGDYIAKLLKDQRPTEIIFPMQDKFLSLDDITDLLRESMEELNVHIKELNLPMDDFDGWAVQLTAEKDTWSHARRKRRLAQRLNNQPEDQSVQPKNTEHGSEGTSLEENTTKNISGEEMIQESREKSDSTEPLLVCNIYVEVVETDDTSDNDKIKICMTFEKGTGGRNALETFRQYLINKLNVREYCQKQKQKVVSQPDKKKRKRLKKSTCSTLESNVDMEKRKLETASLENTVESP